MRKLIWGCAASGALAVCGAFAAAHHAVHHPTSPVGRALHGATHIVAYANPYSGFTPVLARFHSVCGLEANEVAVDVEGVPADPTPEAGDTPVAGPIEAPKDEAPIVIPEAEKSVPPAGAAVEMPDVPANQELVAPATMPPVGDEEACELPMPTCEDEAKTVEYRSWWQVMMGWFQSSKKCADEPSVCPATMNVSEDHCPAKVGECREDRNYHRHYPGCPASGRMHDCHRPPAALPPTPVKDEGGEEASETGARSSALQAIRKLRGRTMVPEEKYQAKPGVDTMEYRPSDRPLYDYGQRPL